MVPDANSQATAQVGIKTATSGNRRRQPQTGHPGSKTKQIFCNSIIENETN